MRESVRVLINVKWKRKEGIFICVQRRKGAVGPYSMVFDIFISVRTEHENGRGKTWANVCLVETNKWTVLRAKIERWVRLVS